MSAERIAKLKALGLAMLQEIATADGQTMPPEAVKELDGKLDLFVPSLVQAFDILMEKPNGSDQPVSKVG